MNSACLKGTSFLFFSLENQITEQPFIIFESALHTGAKNIRLGKPIAKYVHA